MTRADQKSVPHEASSDPPPAALAHRPGVASDPEWRLFVALVGARRKLAPVETLRGRLLQTLLNRAADALDWAYVRIGRPTGANRSQPPTHTHSDLRLATAEVEAVSTDSDLAPATAEAQPVSTHDPSDQSVASQPRGRIDGPAQGSTVRGMVLVWGWALDAASALGVGVTALGVYLDGFWQGTATYGLSRHDVADQFGGRFVPCGWQFALDVQHVSPGPHAVQVLAYSSVSGQETTYSLPLNVEAPLDVPPARKLALFIAGCPGGTRRYRCDHQAQQLALHGATADVVAYGEVGLADVLDRYDFFVLQRVLLSEDVAWFIDQARQRGRGVVYDTDDLIFEVAAAPLVPSLELFTDRQREQFLDCLARAHDALVRCDRVLVSTELLQQRAARLQPSVVITPNVVDQAMVAQAEAVLAGRNTRQAQRSASDPVVMAYLSGTPSHDRDFLEAADALLSILRTYPRTRLRTVGPVRVDARFDQFGERVEQLPLRPWQRLPEVIADGDINLAPLEPNNPFTDAKSCIKYLEAGLLSVPTIASPRPDFRRVIRHGENGLLADDRLQWQAALERLIESPEERRTIGERARQDVLRHHTTASAPPVLLGVLRELASRGAVTS